MKHIAIVATSFHQKEVEIMVEEVKALAKNSKLEITKEVWVPGALETPITLKKILRDKRIDAAIVLGIIERGETKHGLVMGQTVFSAIIGLQLEFLKPIGVGILGPEILQDQIPPRIKQHAREAFLAVQEMIPILQS